MTAKLTISEVSQSFGVTLRTLRFYEQRGLLKPERIHTTRMYSHRDILILQVILKGKRLGFTLREIESLIGKQAYHSTLANSDLAHSEEQVVGKLVMLERKREKVGSAIAELEKVLRCQEQNVKLSPVNERS